MTDGHDGGKHGISWGGSGEPTPPTETQAIKVTRRSLSDPDEVAALLGEIHKDVQDQIHDQWDWMNASFYTECLRCMVHRAREVAAPTERVETSLELDKEERAHEQTIRERDDAEEALSQAYYLVTGRSPEWSNLFGYAQALEDIDDAQQTLRKSVAAVAPSPAGESQHVHTYECIDASGKCRITGEV